MNVLLSGRKGKLQNAAAKALSGQRGIHAKVFPMGSSLLKVVRSASCDVLILVLEEDADLELLRWAQRENAETPLLVVVPPGRASLRKELADEGVAVLVAGPGAREEFPKRLRAFLKKLGANLLAADRPGRRISSDLHTIRSTLTAIQGYAEMAGEKPAGLPETPQEEIIRGVREIERLLRRVENGLKKRGLAEK